MHQTALDTLTSVAEKIESYDESSAALVGVLMLRLLLVTNQPRRAYSFLEMLLQQLGINNVSLAPEECNAQENVPRLDDKLNKNLKLLSLLTNVVNRKIVVVPEDGVSLKNA